MKKIFILLLACLGLSVFGQQLEPITTTNLRVIINKINEIQGLISSGGGNGVTEQWVRDEISDSISAIFEDGMYIDEYLEGYEPDLGNPASDGYVLSSTTAGVRSWIAPAQGGTMTWPASAGIAVYAGSNQWGTSITNNSTNWDAAYSWGDHKVMDINTQTGAAYTLVLADAHRLVIRSNSSANTVTVPTNTSVAFPVGTQITVVQTGTGTTSIAAASGVTINSADGALDLRVRYSACSLVKTAINTWLLIGDIE